MIEYGADPCDRMNSPGMIEKIKPDQMFGNENVHEKKSRNIQKNEKSCERKFKKENSNQSVSCPSGKYRVR